MSGEAQRELLWIAILAAVSIAIGGLVIVSEAMDDPDRFRIRVHHFVFVGTFTAFIVSRYVLVATRDLSLLVAPILRLGFMVVMAAAALGAFSFVYRELSWLWRHMVAPPFPDHGYILLSVNSLAGNVLPKLILGCCTTIALVRSVKGTW